MRSSRKERYKDMVDFKNPVVVNLEEMFATCVKELYRLGQTEEELITYLRLALDEVVEQRLEVFREAAEVRVEMDKTRQGED